MSPEYIALVMIGSMLILLMTGQYIFIILGGIATVAALFLWGTGGEAMPFHSAGVLLGWYPILTLPSFVFMGLMMSKSGLAGKLYDMFHVWAGPVKGGLAMGTIGMSTVIAAMEGLSVAGILTTGTIALPEMLKRKYDKTMALGVIMGGSALGILIPPSIVFILYGLICRQPVGRLWLAGILPGLLLAILFILYIGIRCRLQPSMGPALPAEERQFSWGKKFRLLLAGVSPLALIFVILGFYFMGITNLIECSAIGAIGALVIAAINRQLSWKVLTETLGETLHLTCLFLWIALTAILYSAVFDGLGAIHMVENMFLTIGATGIGVIALMMVSFILMGMVLDDTAMLIIVAPLYVPIVINLGYSGIWFGVLYVITCQIAYLTPPFGYNLFLMKGIAPKDVSIQDIYRSVWPFVGMQSVALGLIMVFPEIALWLPNAFFAL